jgi:CheY-like chemotaxis protein
MIIKQRETGMSQGEFGRDRHELRFSVTTVHVHPAVAAESHDVQRRPERDAENMGTGYNQESPGGGGPVSAARDAMRHGRPTQGPGRVLVVDDDWGIRRLIAVNLTLEGFDVATAVDGQDCLDKVLKAAPDVIVMDAIMPRLDGWKTAVRLRKSPDTSHIKVVLITAARAVQDGPKPGADGAVDAYLGKPFDPAEMIRVVRRLAGIHQSASSTGSASSFKDGGSCGNVARRGSEPEGWR